jgi:hypothetical protein
VGGSPWPAHGGDGGQAEGCTGEAGRPAIVASVGDVGEHLRARVTLLVGSTGPVEHRRRPRQ